MPAKKPSLFGTPYSEPPKEKKPTLLQYIKTVESDGFPILERIDVIWTPGTFDNYTLETNSFRAGITPRNPLYSVLNGSAWGTILSTETAILMSVLDKEGTIELVESNVYGVYKPFGHFGVKFYPTDGAN